MPAWSTDDFPAHERFAVWREVRAAKIYGVTAELESNRHLAFSGRVDALAVADATLVELHASPYRVHRSQADIERMPGDTLCIYQQLDGACWFDTGRGGEFIATSGSLAISHSDLPYRTAPTTEGGFHLRLVKIPIARFRPLIAHDRDLVAQPLVREPGIGALFASYFQAFVEQAPHLQGVGAETAVDMLARLALLARGLASPDSEPGRDAVRAGRLQAVKQFVEANLGRADLAPAMTAQALGISVRQLHLLFEPTGETFSRYVMARRMALAHQLLSQSPGRPTAEIARACAIASPTVFYRSFRAAFGMNPTELRKSLSGSE